MVERAGHVHDRLAGADPGRLGMIELDLEAGATLGRHSLEKLDRETRRADHWPAHEDGIGRLAIAELADDRLRLQEIAVGARGERGGLVWPPRFGLALRSHRRLTALWRAGLRRRSRCWTRCCGAPVSAPRRPRRPARSPGWHSIAGRNVCGSARRARLR